MFYYSVQGGLLLPGHLRKSTFRDQLAIPETLAGLILHAYHVHVFFGGRLATHSDRLMTKPAKNIDG